MKATFNFKQLFFIILIFVLGYIIIWSLFFANGPFQVGHGLVKSDWLLFLGGYLSFVGTITVSYMVIYQNQNLHSVENERMRYSQLPYLKIKLAKVTEDLQVNNGNYVFDFPSLVFENEKFIWKIKAGTALFVPINRVIHEAIYKIENIGLGHAMKFSIQSNDSDHSYNDNLKVNDKLLFRVELLSLKKESQQISLIAKFYDIYNNTYHQKLLCEFVTDGSTFNFDIAKEQFEPQLIK